MDESWHISLWSVSKTQKVELGKVISVETLDDWKADNGEQYEIKITDKSYEHPTTGAVYENVFTDKDPVTTTIKDDTDNTPNDPNDNKVEDNQEQVLLKIFAADSTGAPLKDGSGNYLTVNEVPEGNNAYYVVLAFKPNETTFSDSTKLTIQSGTVEVKTFEPQKETKKKYSMPTLGDLDETEVDELWLYLKLKRGWNNGRRRKKRKEKTINAKKKNS